MSTSDKPLFTQHEHALEQANEICPECGGKLTLKNSKSGAFLGCTQYPSCEYTRPLVEHTKLEDQVLPGTECPLCQSLLAVKQGRYGMFIGCTKYPECDHIAHEESETQADVSCPSCNTGKLKERQSRYGKTFYACDAYPKCKYVVNHPPVNEKCPACGWSIMVKRTMASGEVHMCPQKKCGCKVKL